MDKKIVAIVVTYNRKMLLKQNIESLLKQKSIVPDIFIIDNNSKDGTEKVVKEYGDNEKIYYFNTGENLGGAGGFQFGIRMAMKKKYDYLWLMDDDCIPYEDALENLLHADNKLKGEYGFLSSKVVWKDGSICKMNIQHESLKRKLSNFEAEISKIIMASFVSLFLKAEIVEKVGLPIKEFFIWTDDLEYTRRISINYSGYYIANSIVQHKTDSNITSNIALDKEQRLDRYMYAYRNEIYLYRREGVKGFLYQFFRINLHIIRVILFARNLKWKRIKIIIGGTLNGFHFTPKIEKI